MVDAAAGSPVSLQVYRYTLGDSEVRPVIGELEPELPQHDLVAHAAEALTSGTFMCYAVSQADDFVADELCFVPQGDHCDILSIRTNGWQRHHGDHRRSLVEILNNLAAAVACGKLRVLDADQLVTETATGEQVLHFDISRSAELTTAREAVDDVLREAGIDDTTRKRTTLCISEAVTNMLLYGGGHGGMTLRRLHDRLRVVVADRGPGLNFLNWMEPPKAKGQASMGYGFKIILDYLDAVGLSTGPGGTTLLLDRITTN
ncbi:MAG TPA: ATP-binding protein [Thermoleophilia bacterium]|nr:ATP-binding protein [Thermoleophilia bacterium]